MSSYFASAIHPRTGKVEEAEFLDNFYKARQYAVRFADGYTCPVEKIKVPEKPVEETPTFTPLGGAGYKDSDGIEYNSIVVPVTHTTPDGQTIYEACPCLPSQPPVTKPEAVAEWEKEFDEHFVEMHSMYGHDSHNPPLLYHSKTEQVQDLKSFIRSLLLKERQATEERLIGQIHKIPVSCHAPLRCFHEEIVTANLKFRGQLISALQAERTRGN